MPRHQAGRILLTLLLLSLSIASGAMLGTGPVIADGPDLRLRPDEGPVGTTTRARGRDFPPGSHGIITWGDTAEPIAAFSTSDEGEFEVTLSVPDVPPGDYHVVATVGERSTDDGFTVERRDETPSSVAPPPAPISQGTPPAPSTSLVAGLCDGTASREIDVETGAELEAALADSQPGDRIRLDAGVYTGNFVLDASGTGDERLELCGSPGAVIDGGGWERSGYALHITGDFVTVHTLEVRNAQKGVVLDGASSVVLSDLDVHTIGHEAVHFRTHSTDNVIQSSRIHDTGLDNEKFGEGVYIGSAVSNWEQYTEGEPDRSNRNTVVNTTFWNTSSESIDIKEGTEGGLVEGNVFDGTGLTGADSWVDVKGNGYLIRDNTGTNSPEDGFQTHVIDNLEWGRDNVFEMNIAEVNGSGYGFYIHQPETTGNVVRCDNDVSDAERGATNLPEGCTG